MVKVTNELLKSRQLTLYFQSYHELPQIRRETVPAKDAQDDVWWFKAAMDEYQALDNSPADYDLRKGHLLLAQDRSHGRPVQVSFEGTSSGGRISQLTLDDPGDGFWENHFILTGETFHRLEVSPGSDGAWSLEATHWNRMDLDTAQQQKVKIGRARR